jgi:hypothetical protein
MPIPVADMCVLISRQTDGQFLCNCAFVFLIAVQRVGTGYGRNASGSHTTHRLCNLLPLSVWLQSELKRVE